MFRHFSPVLLTFAVGCSLQSGVVGETEQPIQEGSEETEESAGAPSASAATSTTSVSTSGGDNTSPPSVPAHETCSDATPIAGAPADVAERLSAFIFDAPPSEELLQRAEDGDLDTYGEVECAALEMIQAPEVSGGLINLLQAWLQFDSWPHAPHADIDAELWQEMQDQANAYLSSFVQSDDTTLAHLLLEPETEVGPALAAHLGLEDTGELPGPVSVPEHRGLLTLSMLTASLQRIGGRGAWVVSRLQCQGLAPPPVNPPFEPVEGQTYQESYAEAVSPSACAGCHQLIDGSGMALENFDELGRPQTEELGQPLLTEGEMLAGAPDDLELVAFSNPDKFMLKLSTNGLVAECLARNTLSHATGIALGDADPDEVAKIRASFEAGEHDLAQLLVAATQTASFWE